MNPCPFLLPLGTNLEAHLESHSHIALSEGSVGLRAVAVAEIQEVALRCVSDNDGGGSAAQEWSKVKVLVVENVEDLSPIFQADSLGDLEVLQDVQVHVDRARSVKRVPASGVGTVRVVGCDLDPADIVTSYAGARIGIDQTSGAGGADLGPGVKRCIPIAHIRAISCE